MIGMYAMYGGSLYNITDQQLNPNGISIDRSNHVERILDSRNKIVRLDVTLANSTGFANPLTNGQYYDAAVQLIQSEKITEVQKLSSVYRVFLGFAILDGNGVVADEGYMIKDVKPSLKYTPVHLDDKNEFLNAFTLSFNSRFSRHYRVPVPGGVTKSPAYKLYITSVTIYQLKADAMLLKPTNNSRLVPITPYPSGVETNVYGSAVDNSFRNWNKMVHDARSGMFDQPNSPETDGRMAYTMDPNFIKEAVCIYNSIADNTEIQGVSMAFGPRCVEVNLSVTLDGLFVVDSEEDIDRYLKANEEPDVINPSTPGNEDPTDEPVVNPDNPDGKDPNTIPNPENPNPATEEGGGTTEETPSDTPSEGEGDAGNKDVTDPSGEEVQDPAPGTPSEGTGGESKDPVEPSEGISGDSEVVDPKPDETTGSEDQKTDPEKPEQTETV